MAFIGKPTFDLVNDRIRIVFDLTLLPNYLTQNYTTTLSTTLPSGVVVVNSVNSIAGNVSAIIDITPIPTDINGAKQTGIYRFVTDSDGVTVTNIANNSQANFCFEIPKLEIENTVNCLDYPAYAKTQDITNYSKLGATFSVSRNITFSKNVSNPSPYSQNTVLDDNITLYEPNLYQGVYTSTYFNIITYTYTDKVVVVSVTKTINDFSVDCDKEICDMVCGIRTLQMNMEDLGCNTPKYNEVRNNLIDIGIYWNTYLQGKLCRKLDVMRLSINKIKEVGNFVGGCCGDEENYAIISQDLCKCFGDARLPALIPNSTRVLGSNGTNVFWRTLLQPDWNQNLTTAEDFIKNKPDIAFPFEVRMINGAIFNSLNFLITSPITINNGLGLPSSPFNGWAICNGNNGTPDLRGRFVLAQGQNQNPVLNDINPNYGNGETGGENTHLLSALESGLRKHNHGTPAGYVQNSGGYIGAIGVDRINGLGGDTVTVISVDDVIGRDGAQPALTRHENRPPYYVLAFIMKLP